VTDPDRYDGLETEPRLARGFLARRISRSALRAEGSSPGEAWDWSRHSEPAGRPCPERGELSTPASAVLAQERCPFWSLISAAASSRAAPLPSEAPLTASTRQSQGSVGNGEPRSLTKGQARALKPGRPQLIALDWVGARHAVLARRTSRASRCSRRSVGPRRYTRPFLSKTIMTPPRRLPLWGVVLGRHRQMIVDDILGILDEVIQPRPIPMKQNGGKRERRTRRKDQDFRTGRMRLQRQPVATIFDGLGHGSKG
jgi:hypothetical protein